MAFDDFNPQTNGGLIWHFTRNTHLTIAITIVNFRMFPG